jgi:hypothetical protein
MQLVIESIKSVLIEFGITWEYMTWKIGLSTSFGRLHINCNDEYLRLVLTTDDDIERLCRVTGLYWRDQKQNKRSL